MNKVIRVVSSWLGVLLFVGAVSSLVAFNLIGSWIDEQGILHEPFYLIPMFWFLFTLSLLAAGISIIARIVQTRHKKATNQ